MSDQSRARCRERLLALGNLDLHSDTDFRNWYPGENLEYYRRLDRRMREHNERLQAGETGATTK